MGSVGGVGNLQPAEPNGVRQPFSLLFSSARQDRRSAMAGVEPRIHHPAADPAASKEARPTSVGTHPMRSHPTRPHPGCSGSRNWKGKNDDHMSKAANAKRWVTRSAGGTCHDWCDTAGDHEQDHLRPRVQRWMVNGTEQVDHTMIDPERHDDEPPNSDNAEAHRAEQSSNSEPDPVGLRSSALLALVGSAFDVAAKEGPEAAKIWLTQRADREQVRLDKERSSSTPRRSSGTWMQSATPGCAPTMRRALEISTCMPDSPPPNSSEVSRCSQSCW